MKRAMFVLIGGLAFTACSSNKIHTAEVEPDRVVASMDEAKKPDWASEADPFRVEKGMVYSLGVTEIPADGHRISAAYRIAANNAKANLSTAISQRLSFVLQNAQEGTEIGADQSRYIGAEASELSASEIQVKSQYWEKIAQSHDDGSRTTIVKVYSLVAMPEDSFKRAVMAAMNKGIAQKGISEEFKRQVAAHWNKFVDSSEKEVQRSIASEPEDKKEE